MALNNSQYDTILRVYEQKQLHNRNILDKRQQTVYNSVPEINLLNQQISSLSVKQARRLLEGDEKALLELREQIRLLSKQKEELMVQAGFPADYLDPVYDCPDCKDTGYVNNQKCHCFRKAEIDLLYTQSNVKNILADENFDTFSFRYYSENHVDPKTGRDSLSTMKKAHQTALEFVETFSTEFRSFTIVSIRLLRLFLPFFEFK